MSNTLTATTSQQRTKKIPSGLVALPSVSHALYQLPTATSIDNVALHSNTFSQRSADSHAKLQAALNINKSKMLAQKEEETKKKKEEEKKKSKAN